MAPAQSNTGLALAVVGSLHGSGTWLRHRRQRLPPATTHRPSLDLATVTELQGCSAAAAARRATGVLPPGMTSPPHPGAAERRAAAVTGAAGACAGADGQPPRPELPMGARRHGWPS